MNKRLLILALLVCNNAQAGVYKCTDPHGATVYQSSPCAEENRAIKINTETGGEVDLNVQQEQEKLDEQARLAKQQAELERLAKIEHIKQQAKDEQDKTKALIQQSSHLFSAFAIPAYDYDNLPDRVKPFAERLAEIEKLRRLAAQKALAAGTCQRVEGDELNARSRKDKLVFLVSCSSGANFYFTETELSGQ